MLVKNKSYYRCENIKYYRLDNVLGDESGILGNNRKVAEYEKHEVIY